MPIITRRLLHRGLAVLAGAALLGACSRPAALQSSYQGPLPQQCAAGETVRLQIEILDQAGQRFAPDSLVQSQYRQLAEDAFTKAGWTLAPEAPLEVRITLAGRTPNGVVTSEASLGRNLAVGLLTLGIACNEWTHTVDAAGPVTLLETGTVVASKEIDLKGTAESCHSTGNPNWLADQQQAAIDTYQQAAQAHLAAVLEFVPTSTLSPPAA